MAHIEFLIGLAFSIPVAILAPFATKWIEKYRSERSLVQAKVRRKKIEADIALISKYRDNPSLFNSYLVGRILLLTVITAFGTIGSTFFYTVEPLVGSYQVPQLMGGIIGIIVAVYVIQIGMQALKIRQRVSRSDLFLEQANAELLSLTPPQEEQSDEVVRHIRKSANNREGR
jgi:hypothetical protein